MQVDIYSYSHLVCEAHTGQTLCRFVVPFRLQWVEKRFGNWFPASAMPNVCQPRSPEITRLIWWRSESSWTPHCGSWLAMQLSSLVLVLQKLPLQLILLRILDAQILLHKLGPTHTPRVMPKIPSSAWLQIGVLRLSVPPSQRWVAMSVACWHRRRLSSNGTWRLSRCLSNMIRFQSNEKLTDKPGSSSLKLLWGIFGQVQKSRNQQGAVHPPVQRAPGVKRSTHQREWCRMWGHRKFLTLFRCLLCIERFRCLNFYCYPDEVGFGLWWWSWMTSSFSWERLKCMRQLIPRWIWLLVASLQVLLEGARKKKYIYIYTIHGSFG